ncbi:MAG: hypothetical protein M3552_08230 [Planctomycetota bacterium]|nr:hypothetical protein [Planctomycetaceae bacterium]MDQ3330626.1 hypothetical protein [Planctomycetota bacterium]
MALRQYDMVRVRQLTQSPASYDGWRVNRRPPQVGDVGVLLDVLHAPELSDRFAVELADPDGVTIWLSDFAAEEIEPAGT